MWGVWGVWVEGRREKGGGEKACVHVSRTGDGTLGFRRGFTVRGVSRYNRPSPHGGPECGVGNGSEVN